MRRRKRVSEITGPVGQRWAITFVRHGGKRQFFSYSADTLIFYVEGDTAEDAIKFAEERFAETCRPGWRKAFRLMRVENQ